MAVVWHQLGIKSFAEIRALTRHQIYEIVNRNVDKDGKVELRGRDAHAPGGKGQQELTDYPSIYRHTLRLRYERDGMPPELIAEAVEREMKAAVAAGLFADAGEGVDP